MTSGEIVARLGIDTSTIASDMAKANSAFASGADSAGAAAGEKFGKKFSERIGERFMGRGALNSLFVGIGLDPKEIADTIAGAIVGGSKKGWEEAIQSAEEFSKALDELFNQGSTRGEKQAALKKQIAETNAEISNIGKTTVHVGANRFGGKAHDVTTKHALNDEEIKQLEEANTKATKAQAELNKLAKEDAADQERLHKTKIEDLPIDQKIIALKKEQKDLSAKLTDETKKGILSIGEQAEIQRQIIEYDHQLVALQAEKNRGSEKELSVKEKAAKVRSTVTPEERHEEKQENKISDRSKLSLGELARIGQFQPGVDPKIAQEASQAREAIRLEQQGNKARQLGDSAGAENYFSQSDKIKSGLSSLNSKDRGITDEFTKALNPTHETLKQINKTLSGKFVNE